MFSPIPTVVPTNVLVVSGTLRRVAKENFSVYREILTRWRTVAEDCGGGHGAQGRDGPQRQQISLFQLLMATLRVSFVPPFCASSTLLSARLILTQYCSGQVRFDAKSGHLIGLVGYQLRAQKPAHAAKIRLVG